MTKRTRMLVVGVIVPLLIAAASVVAMLVALPDLPDPVAVHWGPSGAPDRFGTPLGPILLVGVAVLAFSAFAFVMARVQHTVNARIVLAAAPFLATVLGVITAGGLILQRGLADAHDTPSILPVVLVGFGAGIALAVAAWFGLPAADPAPEPDHADLPTLDLGADERAVWFQRLEPARWLGILLVVLGAAAVVGGGVAVWIAGSTAVLVVYLLVMAFLVLASVSSLFWTVRIDSRGLVARSALGFPRLAVPVDDVESAVSVAEGATRDFGGWGLRWAGRGRLGIILRSGPALEVRRRSGGSLVITVAHSERAAALLNSLARRA